MNVSELLRYPLHALHFKFITFGLLYSMFSSPLEMLLCVSVHKVLDGSESQYSGMQIGTLQDEEDEGAAPSSQEEPPEPFLQSALGVFVCTNVHTHINTETLVCTEDRFCLLKL